jgi:hypothetical protein
MRKLFNANTIGAIIYPAIFFAIILTVFVILPLAAKAEHEKNTYNSQKPVSCMTMENMLAIVDGQFGEKPWFTGDGLAAATDGQQFIKTQVVFAVNLETKTFSIIEIINPELVCIIGGGNNFNFNEPPTQKTSISWEN